MNARQNRKYVSPSRKRQALATRNRIIDAAETLLLKKGFAGMTVAEVARMAGVSPQTIYAVFASKAGIISAAVEDRVMNDDRNVDSLKLLFTADDPVVVLGSMVKLTRNIYEGTAPTFAAVYGASLVSPQLTELESELGEIRWRRQEGIAAKLMASGRMLPHLDEETVRDILWALTSREVYHLLVVRRGWTPDRYEKHLSAILISTLVRPETIAACPQERDGQI